MQRAVLENIRSLTIKSKDAFSNRGESMEENKREVIGARSEKQHQFLTNTADVVVFGGGCAS